MLIRPSTYEDAWAAADLLRRSIDELCVADHEGDPARLETWLANKTPETFARWIDDAANVMLSAELEGRLAGVGALRLPREVMLIYVHPDSQRRGVARAIMAALEARAAAEGAAEVGLTSTRTAHLFYAGLGYRDVGEACAFGMPAFRMIKELRP